MDAQSDFSMAEMRFGAKNAIETCMAVRDGERVFILGDEASLLVSRAIAEAAVAVGAQVEQHNLETYAPRPILSPPEQLMAFIQGFKPDVSFYTASGQPGELHFRQLYRPAVLEANPHGARHAHMINVTPLLMTQGMRVDYNEVYQVTMWAYNLLQSARQIHVTNPKGTDLTATFSLERQWVPCHGLYREPGMWGNLPEGEVYTAPMHCNGVIAADVLGDYFSEKYGVLEAPVVFTIEDGYVHDIYCEHTAIQTDVEGYIHGAEFSNRVGEFAVGTNVALTGLVGNLLQDEKLPGVHVAFGDPYGSKTGADWSSPHHIDVIPTHCTITVDGRRIMQDGRFTNDVMAEVQQWAKDDTSTFSGDGE